MEDQKWEPSAEAYFNAVVSIAQSMYNFNGALDPAFVAKDAIQKVDAIIAQINTNTNGGDI